MWFNGIISAILRSPVHGLLSRNTMLITVSGRKTGRLVTTPINYVRADGGLLSVSYRSRTWWRNLRGGAAVEVRLAGRNRRASASVDETQPEVEAGLAELVARAPSFARPLSIGLDGGRPVAQDLARAAEARVIVRTRLEDGVVTSGGRESTLARRRTMSIESIHGAAEGSGPGARRRGLVAYFVLTFLITWGIQLLLIASENSWGGIALPPSVHYLASYGPMLAAITVTAWIGRGPGLKELWGRVARWRVGWGWFLIALLSPAVLFAVGVAVGALLGGEIPDLALLGKVNYMPTLGLGAWIFWFLTYGMGEEIGWRGFALPRLQHGRSAAGATLILGLLWALWHLPPFFYLDTYQQMGLWMYPFLAITIVCGNVIYTWIYNSSGGSVLMAIIFHASFNFFSASAAGAGTIAIVMTAGVVIASLVIPRVYGLKELSRRPRHTL